MGCNARLLSNRLDGVVPRFPLRRRKRKEPENGDLTGRPRPFDHLATAKMSTKSFHFLSSTGCVGRFSFRRAFFLLLFVVSFFLRARFCKAVRHPPLVAELLGRFLPRFLQTPTSVREYLRDSLLEFPLAFPSIFLFVFFVSNRADGCPSCFGR